MWQRVECLKSTTFFMEDFFRASLSASSDSKGFQKDDDPEVCAESDPKNLLNKLIKIILDFNTIFTSFFPVSDFRYVPDDGRNARHKMPNNFSA